MTKRKQRSDHSDGDGRRRKKGGDQVSGSGNAGGQEGGASSSSGTTNATSTSSRRYHNNPRRGGPAFIVTCERGREFKARRDALEILQYYYDRSNQKSRDGENEASRAEVGEDDHEVGNNDSKSTNDTLSFEDELQLLQDQNKQQKKSSSNNNSFQNSRSSSSRYRRFTEFETSIRGVVILMYNDLDATQDQQQQQQMEEDGDVREAEHGNDEENSDDSSSIKWDPIDTFERIYADWKADAEFQKASKQKEEGEEGGKEDNDDSQKSARLQSRRGGDLYAPSSRYITRMIPIQMTCFSSVDDIKLTMPNLLQKFFPPTTTNTAGNKEDENDTGIITTTTYAVAVKIRNCRMIKRQDVIDVVAGYMLENYSPKKYQVQLENPDVTILVEICQTLCGMSIIHHKTNASTSSSMNADEKTDQKHKDHNFNLAMIKERC